MKLMREEIKPSSLNWIGIVAATIAIILLVVVLQLYYKDLW
jgi:hypothetical protein